MQESCASAEDIVSEEDLRKYFGRNAMSGCLGQQVSLQIDVVNANAPLLEAASASILFRLESKFSAR